MRNRIIRNATGVHELKTDQIILCVLLVLAVMLYTHNLHINARLERAQAELTRMEIRLQKMRDQNAVVQNMVEEALLLGKQTAPVLIAE